jgi:uncharacterized phage-like protein YoqJ
VSEEKTMVMGVTGHRPPRIGFSHQDRKGEKLLLDFACAVIERYNPDGLISGMALGTDTAFADAALLLNVPLICALPFEGQEKQWAQEKQDKYMQILELATKVVFVSKGGYNPHKLHDRNHWIVDHCNVLISLWDGVPSGGTYQCLLYAKRKGKAIRNTWKSWMFGLEEQRDKEKTEGALEF